MIEELKDLSDRELLELVAEKLIEICENENKKKVRSAMKRATQTIEITGVVEDFRILQGKNKKFAAFSLITDKDEVAHCNTFLPEVFQHCRNKMRITARGDWTRYKAHTNFTVESIEILANDNGVK